ncbi:uncharacterized protein [Oscarella lobularis]|uniref:uncharacterized protein isoform X2 n=1 Tax=Oscarella lobularis TaxID=121494 RepID=UPI003313AA9D
MRLVGKAKTIDLGGNRYGRPNIGVFRLRLDKRRFFKLKTSLLLRYMVMESPTVIKLSYALSFVERRKQVRSPDSHLIPSYPARKTLYHCTGAVAKLVRLTAKDKARIRRYVYLTVSILHVGGSASFRMSLVRSGCSDAYGRVAHSSGCNFAKGETCDFKNDGCAAYPWSANGRDLTQSPVESCEIPMAILNVPDLQEAFKFVEKTNLNRIARQSSSTGISVDPAGSKGVTIGVCNSPTLEANPDENTAMTFKFRFEEGGSHRIVVLLLCMSEGGDVMPMRKDFRHYAVNNMAPRDPKSGTKCLNIHRYLKGSNFKCTHFQVQFIGAAFGSYLSIDSVYFYKACPWKSFDNID